MEIIIDEFLDYLTYERKYSNYTVNNYKHDLKEFNIFLKKENIIDYKKIDFQVIRKYLLYMDNKKLSKTSICRQISCLRTFFKQL